MKPGLLLRDSARFLPGYKSAIATAEEVFLPIACLHACLCGRQDLLECVLPSRRTFRGVGVCSLSVTIQLLPKAAVPTPAPVLGRESSLPYILAKLVGVKQCCGFSLNFSDYESRPFVLPC